MKRAIELALENVRSGHGGPFGVVIVKGGQALAEGANSVTSTNDPTAHAEIVAIREACRKLKTFQLDGCEIYSSCEPCPMCVGAIYWARVARVYYGASSGDAAVAQFDDALIFREIAQPARLRRIPMTQMMRDEALVAFRAWMEKPDRIRY
ncbi:MAG TPA: nucleoside deaminase [Candidatus Acidoferrales bacterium]|nr:nucleoside deaminase [Candidatus Acidoferrales bacterium]